MQAFFTLPVAALAWSAVAASPSGPVWPTEPRRIEDGTDVEVRARRVFGRFVPDGRVRGGPRFLAGATRCPSRAVVPFIAPRRSPGAQQSFSFAVLHFGDQNITAAVKLYAESDATEFDEFAAKVAEQVQKADFPDVIRLIDRFYGHVDYSLTSLFSDEQRRIVQLILNSTLWDIENSLTNIYEDHASLLHYLSQAGLPKPPALTLAAGFAINAGLRRALDTDPIDVATMRSFLQLAKADQVPLETATLSYIADQRMKRAMVELQLSAGSLEMLDRAVTLARTLTEMPFELNLWQAQNIWYEILRSANYALTALEDEERPKWEKDFAELGQCLSIDTKAISEQDLLVETTGD